MRSLPLWIAAFAIIIVALLILARCYEPAPAFVPIVTPTKPTTLVIMPATALATSAPARPTPEEAR